MALDLMRKFGRYAVIAFVAVVAAGIAGLATYDGFHFYPHVSRATAIANSLDRAKDWPSSEFLRLWKSQAQWGRTCWSAKLLYLEVNAYERLTPGQWMLWCVLSTIHLTEQEQLALYLKLTPVGIGRKGLIGAASDLFGKHMADLTVDEMGVLLALARLPYLRDRPEKLNEIARSIIRASKNEI